MKFLREARVIINNLGVLPRLAVAFVCFVLHEKYGQRQVVTALSVRCIPPCSDTSQSYRPEYLGRPKVSSKDLGKAAVAGKLGTQQGGSKKPTRSGWLGKIQRGEKAYDKQAPQFLYFFSCQLYVGSIFVLYLGCYMSAQVNQSRCAMPIKTALKTIEGVKLYQF